jgi:hypothetical protein
MMVLDGFKHGHSSSAVVVQRRRAVHLVTLAHHNLVKGQLTKHQKKLFWLLPCEDHDERDRETWRQDAKALRCRFRALGRWTSRRNSTLDNPNETLAACRETNEPSFRQSSRQFHSTLTKPYFFFFFFFKKKTKKTRSSQ